MIEKSLSERKVLYKENAKTFPNTFAVFLYISISFLKRKYWFVGCCQLSNKHVSVTNNIFSNNYDTFYLRLSLIKSRFLLEN